MGIARSTFYDLPTAVHDDTAIVEAIAAICDEFEFYGLRRVRAELRHRGMIVNHKKIRRLMREHDLQPRRLGLRQLAFLTVRRLQRRQIALNARLDLLDTALNRAARERSVAGIPSG